MAESRSSGYVCSGSFMSKKLQTKGDSGLRVEWTGDGRMGEGKSKDKTKARVPASYFTSGISV